MKLLLQLPRLTRGRWLSLIVLYSFSTNLPTTPIVLALYVTYVYTQKYAHRTILTHLAAISYMHRCHQMAEPNKNFLVQRALLGVKRCVPVQDCRLPISLPLLYRLHGSVNHLISRPYARAMFQAMYMLAFYAFLRVGEFTLSHGQADNLLQFHQIMLDADRKAVQVGFHRYKHSKGKQHVIYSHSSTGPVCPVETLKTYIQYRGGGEKASPLFIQQNGCPVTRAEFTNAFNKSIDFLGISRKFYKPHSFRIGAASHFAQLDMSYAQIRHMERWASNAFKSYIR